MLYCEQDEFNTINYKNYIKELIEELEDAKTELAVYARLLAMESDLAQWLQNELENKTVPAHITDTMLSLCTDHGTVAAHTINTEVLSLLNFLDTYWRGTAEVRVGGELRGLSFCNNSYIKPGPLAYN